jgi:histidinol phosphatase-like enzyme
MITTNQAGIARGYYTEKDKEVTSLVNEELEKGGAHITPFIIALIILKSFTSIQKDLYCRKPAPE